MSTRNLGSLASTPRSFNSFNVNEVDPTDVFKFSIGSTRNISNSTAYTVTFDHFPTPEA